MRFPTAASRLFFAVSPYVFHFVSLLIFLFLSDGWLVRMQFDSTPKNTGGRWPCIQDGARSRSGERFYRSAMWDV